VARRQVGLASYHFLFLSLWAGDKSGLGSSGVSADAAVEALARCLRSSASLRELDLRLNGFDAVHLEELAAAAREGDGKRREPIELRL